MLASPQAGFDAWGETVGELCARSAEATFQIMGWPDTLAVAERAEVVFRAPQREDLLRGLLEDLLARFAADGFFVHRAACASLEQFPDGALEVQLTCAAGSVDLVVEEALTPVRGVAPGVRVWDESGLVRARVLLDT